MLAGRPHEAAGNGSPRWMAAGPRERVHRTRPTGQLARCLSLAPALGVLPGQPGPPYDVVHGFDDDLGGIVMHVVTGTLGHDVHAVV
jgi:hypothetical protein